MNDGKIGENIVFSDNTGSVGWTCFHGLLTPEDMSELKKLCPRGNFSACFGTAWDKGHSILETPEGFREYLNWDNNKWAKYRHNNPVERAVFYFNFPLDLHGENLLRKLGFEPEKCRFWDRRDYVRGL